MYIPGCTSIKPSTYSRWTAAELWGAYVAHPRTHGRCWGSQAWEEDSWGSQRWLCLIGNEVWVWTTACVCTCTSSVHTGMYWSIQSVAGKLWEVILVTLDCGKRSCAEWVYGSTQVFDNPFQKPIENVVFSAKWNVHIWNRLRECYSSLYTGMLKTPGPQRSNFRRLKFQLKLTWLPFAIGAIFKTPQSNAKCALECRAPRAGPHTFRTQ